jgi:cell division septal protein FtsQ
MWFKRKARNRRLHGGTVLDVKLRSDQARATRTRALAIGLSVLFGTVFCFYLLWRAGLLAVNELVYQNPAFSIAEVDARTDGVILPDQIKRWAGVKIGDNLMALDLAHVKRDLELVPVTQSVTVERVLPRVLRIRVTERQAVAEVNVARPRPGGGLQVVAMQLDAEGYVMLPLDPRLRTTPLGQPEEPLPVLTGVNIYELQTGRRVESPQVRAALELIAKFNESPMAALVVLKRVDVTSPDVLVATTGQGSEITFGLRELDQQLLRWREIYDQGMRYRRAIATLDLAVPNNIPATWLEASAVPAPTPKPVKPTRTRRRNV